MSCKKMLRGILLMSLFVLASTATTASSSTVPSTTAQPETDQSTTAQPTTAQPTTDQPTTAQPTTAQPTTDQPTTDQPTTNQSATAQPTTDQPTTNQSATDQPTTDQPTTNQSATDQPTTDHPTTNQSATAQPTADHPTTNQSATTQPITAQPTTNQSATAQPTTYQPTTNQSATAQPTTYQPTTNQSATDQPTTDQPTTDQPTTNQSATDQPTTDQPTTAQPTTAQPTTAVVTPKVPTKRPEKPFVLSIEIGQSDTADVYCTNDCTYNDVSERIRDAFINVTGFLYVRQQTAQRRKRETSFTVQVVIDQFEFSTLEEGERKTQTWDALRSLNASGVIVVKGTAEETIADAFAKISGDVCKVQDTCPKGYTCTKNTCHHQCENVDCGTHGVCNAVVNTSGMTSIRCVCNSDDDYTYSGSNCEDSEMSKAKAMAILGGVLGAFCALFLVIILIMCCRRKEGDSQGKYQMGGGYSNSTHFNIDVTKM